RFLVNMDSNSTPTSFSLLPKNLPLEDQTMNQSCPQTINKQKYHLHIDIESEYMPLLKKSKSINKLSVQALSHMRSTWHKNIDILCDGSIYPINPNTLSTPPFSNPTSLLRFTGDGPNGLLGYCKTLSESYSHLNTVAKNQ